MTYSSAREAETLDQCETILRRIGQLRAEVAEGPRLTVLSETARDTALATMEATYKDLADHCRRNLA